ncbi:hypothetical protein Bca4012_057804 [Brassica carinata]
MSSGGYKPVNTVRHTITTVSKRKRSSISEPSSNHEPAHRPHPSLAPAGSNRKPSKSSRRRRRIRKERISSSVERQWVFSPSDFRNLKDKVVLVSYNLLGVDNASNHMDLYYNIPRNTWIGVDGSISFARRLVAITQPSYVFRQEVDRFDDLDSLLKNRGFQGVHKMNGEDPKSKLRMQSSEQTSTSPRRLVVGNIHVLFNPKRGDIKLGQVRLLLERAYKLSQEWGNIPVAIAGDLNSTPKSAIYDFVASADLDTQLHDRRQISGQSDLDTKKSPFRNHYAVSASQTNEWSQEELQLATGGQTTTHVRHQLTLNSAYAGVPGTLRTRDQCGEPLATTCHSRFQGTVDYIWHTKELVPVRVLETLPNDVLRRTGGLPSEKWGSDHLAIACELGFVVEPLGSLMKLQMLKTLRESCLPELFFARGDTGELVELEGGGATEEETLGASPPIIKTWEEQEDELAGTLQSGGSCRARVWLIGKAGDKAEPEAGQSLARMDHMEPRKEALRNM